MKKLFIVTAIFLVTADGYSQVGIQFGSGGFGMGMSIPLNNRKNIQRNQRIENHVQQLKYDLDLDNNQVVKVRNLLIKRDRVRNGSSRSTMTNMEFDSRMQEILTPEQYTKYNELKQQRREERKGNRKDNGNDETKKEPLPQWEWDDVYQ